MMTGAGIGPSEPAKSEAKVLIRNLDQFAGLNNVAGSLDDAKHGQGRDERRNPGVNDNHPFIKPTAPQIKSVKRIATAGGW